MRGMATMAHTNTAPSLPPMPVVESEPLTALAPDALFINRELSWLDFNKRVLEEAWDERHPLLERVRFLSIFGANLDEFFMIRVPGLQAQRAAGVADLVADGLTPTEALSRVSVRVGELISEVRACWRVLMNELRRERIEVRHWASTLR